MEPQSHAALARETVGKLEAYARGTPAALERFCRVREMMRREEMDAAGSGGGGWVEAGTGGSGGPVAGNTQVPVVAATGYDASRDPRRRV